MKLGICAALASVVALCAPAAFAQTVYLEFAPQAGTVWTVNQTRTQIKAEGGAPIESKVTATITVIEETDDGYVMEWTTNTVSVGGIVIQNQPDMLVGVPMRFDADFDGTPIRLHDLEGVIDTALALIGGQSSGEAAQRTRAMFSAMQPEEAAGLLLNDASTIMQCHNFELEPNVVIEGSSDTPNPVAGPPILTHSMVVMEDAGGAGRPARIRVEQSFDSESATASIYASIESLAGKAKADEMLRDGKLPPLDSSARITCHIDVASGVAIRVDSDKEIRIDNSYSRDTRTITMTPR